MKFHISCIFINKQSQNHLGWKRPLKIIDDDPTPHMEFCTLFCIFKSKNEGILQ